MEGSCILFGGLGLRPQTRIQMDLYRHDGCVAIVSELHNRTPSNEVSSIYDVEQDSHVFSRHFLSHSAQQSGASAI